MWRKDPENPFEISGMILIFSETSRDAEKSKNNKTNPIPFLGQAP
jgi:hypothetical protein